MIKEKLDKINNQIIDVRMKNRLNEHIEKILENDGKIRIYSFIIVKDENQRLIIRTQKDNISYTYKEKNYNEKYQIFKIKEDYISEYKNNEIKQISVFKKEQEIIKHIEEKNQETTYIRTKKNNILLIEKNKEKTNYYIGINENKYDNYIPQNSIFTEIQEDDYINLISKKIQEETVLQKYCITEKKLHLH